MYEYTSIGRNKITIVGVQNENTVALGVARCGNDDRYSPELGVEIATHRATIQPFCSIAIKNKEEFSLAANVIVSHIESQRQPSLKNLKKHK